MRRRRTAPPRPPPPDTGRRAAAGRAAPVRPAAAPGHRHAGQRRRHHDQWQALPPQPGPDGGQQLEIAIAHALLARQQAEQPIHRPQHPVAGHRADDRVGQEGEAAPQIDEQPPHNSGSVRSSGSSEVWRSITANARQAAQNAMAARLLHVTPNTATQAANKAAAASSTRGYCQEMGAAQWRSGRAARASPGPGCCGAMRWDAGMPGNAKRDAPGRNAPARTARRHAARRTVPARHAASSAAGARSRH